jgi:Fur family transcriptional regulator, ferric uptake regulator
VTVTISEAAILTTFTELGLRNTAPRRAIADWLARAAANGRDFSADDLWQDLLQGAQPGGRATVFRTLDALERNGILDRIELADGSRRYRVCGSGEHHHHIVCVVCGKVSEVRTACLSTETVDEIEDETGFSIERHSIELFGKCESCK